ncbi:signal peptidase complex subunit 3-like [Gigantopelta aegis]|uniref:signal peptidase complex subunit 3-like n=1 Tax=Gigantopelta aegis TaxID=1735272 RepID=UPI001B88C7C6|nr:signal peptidase complex subunit 3-like [Gigantopelta aegis]
MNTFLSRLNTIFAFTLSVMAALTFFCFLTTAFNLHKQPITLKTGKVTVKNVPDYSQDREKSDLAFVVFDMQADLEPLFNWNVKQLFLYLTAEYETKDHALNQVVLWDKIIQRGDGAILDLSNSNTKYYFWDYGNGLKGNKNVTLSLSWNVIPNAGTLPKIRGDGSHTFQFPDQYTPGRF